MPVDSTLLTIITGTGVTGVFCVLFLLGIVYPRSVVEDLRAERDALRAAVRSERDRADASVAAAQVTHDVMAALQAGVAMGYRHREQGTVAPGGPPAALGETGPT